MSEAISKTAPENIVDVDIAIIGGGIAGLWLLNRLLGEGYNAVLFEQGQLGSPQTIASQGMIHGGIKYALGGALTGSSEAIADMPEHWRRCLRGEGDVDLRAARVLSDHFYMWSTQSLGSRLGSFFASRLTRGRVEKVGKRERPPVFNSPQFQGGLYRLVDLVLDVPSLLQTLADNARGRIFQIDWQSAQLLREDHRVELQLQAPRALRLRAQQFVFSAGAGNAELLKQLGLDSPAMQIRPLQQVLVKHDYDQPLYAHCMGANPSPRLTVSSHRCRDGRWCWYLGGDLATEGVGLSSEALIARAKQELAELFPWIDFGRCEWATLAVDRAEPRQPQLIKSDKAFAEAAAGVDNLIVGWPTKLTLAPNMATEVCSLLQRRGLQPGAGTGLEPLQSLPVPAVAEPFWETLF